MQNYQHSKNPIASAKLYEKIFHDAQSTGEISLIGKKLHEFPKCSSKYDFIDVHTIDISRNSFSKIPKHILFCFSLEKFNCQNNHLRSLPTTFCKLINLVQLNISHNPLTVLPLCICSLKNLEILLASNCKLISLPEEIEILHNLMHLDISGNELACFPPLFGRLRNLKVLNLRKNLLCELPPGLCKMQLTYLNISFNRVTSIPMAFSSMISLQEFILNDNPLICPPANICAKGLVHIQAYLFRASQRENRKLTHMQLSNSVPNITVRHISTSLLGSQNDVMQNSLAQNGHFNKRLSDSKIFLNGDNLNGNQHFVMDSGYVTADNSTRSYQSYIENDVDEEEYNSDNCETPKANSMQSLNSPIFINSSEENSHISLRSFSSSSQGLPNGCIKALENLKERLDSADPSFTFKRNLLNSFEEEQKILRMKQLIESRLKLHLPVNLSSCLKDGIILCQLANILVPSTIPIIHFPRQSNEPLSIARCRMNIENFLTAATKFGLVENQLCSSASILEEKSLIEVADIVISMVELSSHFTLV